MSVTDEQTALAKARLKSRNLARVVREQQATIERLEARVRELEAMTPRGVKSAVPQGTWDAGTNVPRADTCATFPSSPHDSQSQSRSRREGDAAHAVTRATRPNGRGDTQTRCTRGTDNGGGARPGGKVSGTRRDRAGGADATTARGSW